MGVRTVALATILALSTTAVAAEPRAGAPLVVAAAKRPTKKPKGRGKQSPAPPATAPSEPDLVAPPLEAAPKPEAATPPAAPGVLPAPPALSTKYRAVAVLPVEAADVGGDLVRSIEQSLINEIDEKSGFRAVSPRDVASEAASYPLDSSKCSAEDVACWAQIARYARAHLAVMTRIASLGGVINVSMRLLDTQTASELGRVAEALSEKADERAGQLHRMAVQLITPADYVGTLIVKSDENGADIYLNDRLVGTTPMRAPLKNLPAGPYILHVSKEGFANVYQFVDVTYNRASTITVSLATNTISGAIAVESDTGFGQVYVISNLPGVEIRIDGEPKGTTPLAGPITQVAAGKRRLSLRREGGPPLIREIPVEAGKRTDVGVTINPDGTMSASVKVVGADSLLPTDSSLRDKPVAALGAGAPEDTGSHPVFVTGLIVGGVGVATLGVAALFANQVRAANDDAAAYANTIKTSSDPTERADARAKLAELNADGPGKETRQWVALGVGTGLLLTGGFLIAADHWHWFGIGTAKADNDDGLRLAIVPAPGGVAMGLSTTW